MAKYFAMLDKGFTRDQFEKFLNQYKYGPEFETALRECIVLATAPPTKPIISALATAKRRSKKKGKPDTT